MHTSPPSDASLPELLMQRARNASDSRLALDAGVGTLVAVAAGIWRGPAWVVIMCAALCFAAFGAWGIADRELRDPSFPSTTALRVALRGVRAVAVVAGALATLTLIFGMVAVGLGNWIS